MLRAGRQRLAYAVRRTCPTTKRTDDRANSTPTPPSPPVSRRVSMGSATYIWLNSTK